MAIKKYSKVKFTLRKELIFILAAVAILVVATILLNRPSKEEKFLEKWSLTENNPYEEISFDELEGILNDKENGEYTFVFFGTPENTETQSYIQTMTSLSELLGVSHIYLVDSEFVVDGDRENDDEFDKELSDIEAKFQDADGNTISLDSVNNFWLFNGNVLEKSADDYEVSGSINWAHALIQMFTFGKA